LWLGAVRASGDELRGVTAGGGVAVPQAGGDPRAQLRVDVGPVGDQAGLHLLADLVAGVTDDVRHRMLAVDVTHDVAIQRAGLDEVVVLRVLLMVLGA